MQNLKLNLVTFVVSALLASSFAFAPSAFAGPMRDSIGKLKPGVYAISTGTHYVQKVILEVFNDQTFRVHLQPGGEMTAISHNLLVSGRIIEDKMLRTDDGFQSFDLKVDHIYQVKDVYTGLWSPVLVQTLLTELPLNTLESVEFSLNLAIRPRAYGLIAQETALLETRAEGVVNPPSHIVIFQTRNHLPQSYTQVSDRWYSRFDRVLTPNPESGFKSCEGLFRAAL